MNASRSTELFGEVAVSGFHALMGDTNECSLSPCEASLVSSKGLTSERETSTTTWRKMYMLGPSTKMCSNEKQKRINKKTQRIYLNELSAETPHLARLAGGDGGRSYFLKPKPKPKAVPPPQPL